MTAVNLVLWALPRGNGHQYVDLACVVSHIGFHHYGVDWERQCVSVGTTSSCHFSYSWFIESARVGSDVYSFIQFGLNHVAVR